MESFCRILDAVGYWLLRASWQASALVLLVLALQWISRKRLSPRWRCALWWLVLIRLALPVAPESSLSLFNWFDWRVSPPDAKVLATHPSPAPGSDPISGALVRVPSGNLAGFSGDLRKEVLVQPAAVSPSAPSSPRPNPAHAAFPWGRTLMVCWLCGLGAVGGRLGRSVLRLRRELRHARLLSDGGALELLEACRRQMGVRPRLTLWETAAVASPALCGLLWPRLLLPTGLVNRFTPQELRFVFLHELAHVRRRDILANWLTALLQAVYWFNPIVWLAFVRMRADRELACDAMALSRAHPDEKRAYGETIIKLLDDFAQPSLLPGLVGILEDKGEMRRRILEVAAFKRSSRWSAILPLPMVALGFICLTDARTSREPHPLAEVHGATRASSQPAVPLRQVAPAQASRSGEAASASPSEGLLWGTVFFEGKPVSKAELRIVNRSGERAALSNLGLTDAQGRFFFYPRPEEPLDWVREENLDWPQVCDAKAAQFFRGQYEFYSTPDFLWIGADGRVVARTAKLEGIEKEIEAIATSTKTPGQTNALTVPAANDTNLMTRNFKLDLNTLNYNLKELRGQGPGWVATNRFQTSTNSADAPPTRGDAGRPVEASDTFLRLNQYFAALGVDLSSPKAMFYSERKGHLTARGTASDLAIIEQAIQALNSAVPQVEISVMYVELWEETGKNDNVFGALAPAPAGQNPVAATNPALSSTERSAVTNFNAASLRPEGTTGILTPEQYRFVMKAIEQRKHAAVLSSPSITTISGRQAQIKVVDVRYVVTGLTNSAQTGSKYVPITEPFECGPILDILPTVGADGCTISMVVTPTIREFLGYDAEGAIKVQDATKGSSPIPTPKFRVRQVTTAATLWDGQTLMLGAGSTEDAQRTKDKVPMLGDLPLVGRMFQTESTLHRRKSLLIFLTPTIIDPAGNPVHGPNELPFRNRGIPRQRPTETEKDR